MRISLENPDQADVIRLIEELDAFQKPLYPVESFHGISLESLKHENVRFAVARSDDGAAIACGAIVLNSGYGELKRFYTSPSQRGKGVAKQLLAFLEGEAKKAGCNKFALETGHLQPEAIRFYSLSGYERCGPFGKYQEDPNSIFMVKAEA